MTTSAKPGSPLPTLTLAALGIVYGDIGTSPLYAFKEVFAGAHHAVAISPANILGALSLVFWSLIVVVSLKYMVFIMRADNAGEGGIMALLALAMRSRGGRPLTPLLVAAGLFGAALFYGDGAITPAISVLSAMEGLQIGTPALTPYVVPATLLVLTMLFAFQKYGTARIGRLFGPIVALWFIALAALGIRSVAQNPEVLAALNPAFALDFIAADPWRGFFTLGAVFLALTGAEALYADMGHFGRRPVQIAWFGLVLPALLLNYFGQGALLLAQPEAIDNPFYRLAPSWALYPMVALSTLATVIASQAVISGVYSITHQAMQLGYVPRVTVQHTSDREAGQIYMPGVNWALFLAVVLLVVGFGSSGKLAAAYGIAVSGTMIITTLLAYVVMRHLWQWSLWRAGLLAMTFLAVDLLFFGANIAKVADGGWLPLAAGALIFLLMTSWKRGYQLLRRRLEREEIPVQDFLHSIAQENLHRIPGTAIFLTSRPGTIPHALLHSLKHYKGLHEHIILMTVRVHDQAHIAAEERLTIDRLNAQFHRITIHYGFMDEQDIPALLPHCAEHGLPVDMQTVSFFLGHETLLTRGGGVSQWRKQLFIAMFRNASNAAAHFRLPPNRVVELGTQIEI